MGKGHRIRQQRQQPQMPKVEVTPDDLQYCKCGSCDWIPSAKLFAKRNPVIGEPPLLHTAHQFICVKCYTPFVPMFANDAQSETSENETGDDAVQTPG